MPNLGKNEGKTPNLAFFAAILYYKNAIKIDSAGIAVFAYYEVPDFDLIGPENRTLLINSTLGHTISEFTERISESEVLIFYYWI
jgi:hypothetical protein